MIEGEGFKPTEIEEIIESIIKLFIKDIMRLDVIEYKRFSKEIVAGITQMPKSLEKVARKLYVSRR